MFSLLIKTTIIQFNEGFSSLKKYKNLVKFSKRATPYVSDYVLIKLIATEYLCELFLNKL